MIQEKTGKEKTTKEKTVQESAKQETKKKITDAFWNLYKTTSIEKITVKKITDGCGIYRTTFYLHFADVYAILEEIEAGLLEDLKKITVELDDTEDESEALVEDIHRSFGDNYEYLHILLDGKHHPEFTLTYKKELLQRLCSAHRIDVKKLDETSRVVAAHTFSAMIDLFLALADTRVLSFEHVIAILQGYMKTGIVDTLIQVQAIVKNDEKYR